MEQHPVPRQITTFEFKLIGFLTLKQFIYLVIFIPSGVVVFYIFPIPILNILFAIAVGSLGLALAFLPINDRPLDIWLKNLYKRLTSPTQYIYQKNNPSIYFLKNLVFESDPHRVVSHIRSQELLNQYLTTKKGILKKTNNRKQTINQLFNQSLKPKSVPDRVVKENANQPSSIPSPDVGAPKLPFFSGVVKNHKLLPLPGILIYVKDEKGETLRLLKTNPHGVFATFTPLSPGEYTFEIKDPKNTYFFDTMKIKIDSVNKTPIEIFSKELL